MARELGEAEVDEPVQLAQAVADVLHQTIAQPDQLTQLLCGAVGQPRRGGAFLGGEARDAAGVDGVGLGARELLVGKPPRAQRIEQGDGEAARHQHGEEILPVMAGRLQGDERVGRRPEQAEEPVVPGGVFGELRRPDEDGVGLVDHRDDVCLAGDVDAHEAHGAPLRRGQPGASEPVLTLTLVHARTLGAPRDTVRVLSTGRGRQSHCRGRRLKRATATLSRIPSISHSTGRLQ